MAKTKPGRGFNGWGGRRTSQDFTHLISPVGENCVEDNGYSPSKTVDSAKAQGRGQASRSESARDQRRG